MKKIISIIIIMTSLFIISSCGDQTKAKVMNTLKETEALIPKFGDELKGKLDAVSTYDEKIQVYSEYMTKTVAAKMDDMAKKAGYENAQKYEEVIAGLAAKDKEVAALDKKVEELGSKTFLALTPQAPVMPEATDATSAGTE